MLRTMREQSGSWIIKILLGIIIVVFVLLGVGTVGSQKASRVAAVGKDTISFDEYKASYKRLLAQLQRQFGNNLSDELLKMMQVDKRAMDELINRRLLVQEANRLNLRISDTQLVEHIRAVPEFQANGAFDPERYQMLLRANNLTPEGFEADQRIALIANLLQQMVTEGIAVSEAEARSWFDWDKKKVVVAYAAFKPAAYTPPAPTPEELETFYKETEETYRTAPQINVRYLAFNPAQFKASAQPSDDEINEYYEVNSGEYILPKTVKARHILFKVGPTASDERIEAARKKAEDVLAKVRDGEEFSALAKTYSEGPSAENGGELGEFRYEDMVEPFSEKAFSMAAGEVSEPVRTDFGWHIIKVESVHDREVKSVESVRDEIVAALIQQKSSQLAYEAADNFHYALVDGEAFDLAAQAVDKAPVETDFFPRNGKPLDVSQSVDSQFSAETFNLLEPNDITDIMDLEGVFYVAQLIARKKGSIPELAAVETDVRAAWIQKKKDEMAKADADACLAAATSAGSLNVPADEAAAPWKVQTTELFGRDESVAGIDDPAFVSAAFMLTSKKPVSETVVNGSDGYYVLDLKEVVAPTDEAFEAEKDAVLKRLKAEKSGQAFTRWMDSLRASGDVWIREDLFVN